MATFNDIPSRPGQRCDFSQTSEMDRSRPRTLTPDASNDWGMQTMDFNFGLYFDATSPFLGLGDMPSWPMQSFDQLGSPPPAAAACLAEMPISHASPSPMATMARSSPLPSALYPSPSPFQSPSSTTSYPSPNQHPSPPAMTTATYQASPGRDADFDTPSPRTSLEDRRTKPSSSSQSSRDHPVFCLYPGCVAKPFKRRADLDRHYKHRHACESQKQSYNCDYPRCSRRRDPFHRLDHFRDHLREYHKEDIEKRGGPVNQTWLEERRVSSTWWRCSKCLKRIAINDFGYECPHCKTACQAKRKEARRRA